MANLNVAVLIAASDRLSAPLRGMSGALGGMEAKLRASARGAADFNARWARTIQLGQQVGAGMLVVGGMMVLAAQQAVRAAAFQEAAEDRLRKIYAAGAEEIIKYAAARQKLTRFGDEETIAAAAVGATYVKLRSSMKEAIAAAQDISEAYGTDLTQSMHMLGKASGGLIMGLRRVGIMVDQNDFKARGMAAVYDEVRHEFQNIAATSDSASKRMGQLTNALGDMREELGNALLPLVKETTPRILELSEALRDLAKTSRGQQTIRAAAWVAPLTLALGGLLVVLPHIVSGIGLVTKALSRMNVWGAVALEGVVGLWHTFTEEIPRAGARVEDFVRRLGRAPTIMETLSLLTQAYGRGFGRTVTGQVTRWLWGLDTAGDLIARLSDRTGILRDVLGASARRAFEMRQELQKGIKPAEDLAAALAKGGPGSGASGSGGADGDKKGTDALREYNRAWRDAAIDRRNAGEAMEEAQRGVAEAHEDAARRITEAERQVAEALRGVNEARQRGMELVEEARKAAADAEKSAAQRVAEAEQAIKDFLVPPTEYELRQREWKRLVEERAAAHGNLKDTQERNAKAIAEAEAEAAKLVVDAQEQMMEARQALTAAHTEGARAVEQAVRHERDAAESLASTWEATADRIVAARAKITEAGGQVPAGSPTWRPAGQQGWVMESAGAPMPAATRSVAQYLGGAAAGPGRSAAPQAVDVRLHLAPGLVAEQIGSPAGRQAVVRVYRDQHQRAQ